MKARNMTRLINALAVLMVFGGLFLLAACDESSEVTNVTPTEPGQAPVPGFTVNVNNFTVTVSDTSVNATSVSYDWGDGLSDSIQSGSHNYSSAGNYTIVQTVANEFGSDTASKTVAVGDSDPPPIAAFEVVNIQRLTVSFRDRSTNATEWEWDFGDGERDAIRSPNHTYRSPGTFTIILTVRNGSGENDRTDQTITLQDDPAAGFTVSIDGLEVTVADTSENADTVEYTWGDGTSDRFDSGSHAYAAAGTYPITQMVENSAGEDETTQTVTVAP